MHSNPKVWVLTIKCTFKSCMKNLTKVRKNIFRFAVVWGNLGIFFPSLLGHLLNFIGPIATISMCGLRGGKQVLIYLWHYCNPTYFWLICDIYSVDSALESFLAFWLALSFFYFFDPLDWALRTGQLAKNEPPF